MVALLLGLLAVSAQAREHALRVANAEIRVVYARFPRAATDDEVAAFVRESAKPVSAHYGRFPVPKLRLEIERNARSENGCFGREFHGNRIVLYLGEKADRARLDGDQMLTHEMFHLGFPDLAREHAWIEEGLATWLAHRSRARVGQDSRGKFWRDVKEGFEDATPDGAATGFAEADDYRRMYWGGALFWFELDLELRAKGKSLDGLTKAILAAGGTNARRWTLGKLRRFVDRYAGFALFRKWEDRLGPRPGRVDLAAHWKELGVAFAGKDVSFDENAPRAADRRAIEGPPSEP